MVHNSLTVRRFIVTSPLCSQCVPSNGQGRLCNASPLTGDPCPNDIRPVAAPRAVQRVHPHECFRSEVRGPRPLVALPAMRVRAFYAHVPAGHSLNVKCFGVTDSHPTALTASSLPSVLPQHFVLITKSLSGQTKLVEKS